LKFMGGLWAVQTEMGAIQVVLGNVCNICKSRKAAQTLVISHLVDLASGDVVQLVRTLPCHSLSIISLLSSITCDGYVQRALSPSRFHFSS
jgi:hypothetical protein